MQTKDKIILVFFVLFLILGSLFLWFINSQGAICISNPAKFTYDSLVKSNPDKFITCSCKSDGLTFLEYGQSSSLYNFSNT